MAALKAIKITETNQSKLAALFNIDDFEGLIDLDFWLVTEFGNEETFFIISLEKMKEEYQVVRPILNDFVEIKKK